jgi:DNA-binding response OmpR family regulator
MLSGTQVSSSARVGGYIAVVGSPSRLDNPDGVVSTLRQLGAEVRALDYRADPRHFIGALDEELGLRPKAVVLELLDRPELALASRRALRRHAAFEGVGMLLVVHEHYVTNVDTRDAFEDFLVAPYSVAELYVRVRALRGRVSTKPKDVFHQLGEISIDSRAREVRVGNRPVRLTRKEYALLVQLCAHGGRAVAREQLLSDIWGSDYAGGRRTVDIHVRRLRAKLGPAFALETLRGWGYRLRTPPTSYPADELGNVTPPSKPRAEPARRMRAARATAAKDPLRHP